MQIWSREEELTMEEADPVSVRRAGAEQWEQMEWSEVVGGAKARPCPLLMARSVSHLGVSAFVCRVALFALGIHAHRTHQINFKHTRC